MTCWSQILCSLVVILLVYLPCVFTGISRWQETGACLNDEGTEGNLRAKQKLTPCNPCPTMGYM